MKECARCKQSKVEREARSKEASKSGLGRGQSVRSEGKPS